DREGHGLPPTSQSTGSGVVRTTRPAAVPANHFPLSPSGTGLFASPVAAHSTPRIRSAWNPTLPFIAATSCPRTFSTTRPFPYVATQTTGSCLSVFFGSSFLSEKAVTSTTLPGSMTEFGYNSSFECGNSAGRSFVIGWSPLRTVRLNSCRLPWLPCVRHPPAITFSNSLEKSSPPTNALEAWWYTISPLPPLTASVYDFLLSSHQTDSGAPFFVSR